MKVDLFLNQRISCFVVWGMKPIILSILGFGLITHSSIAGETIFGQEGSGRPTNTVVGALFGAAAGAAIGQATGGEDGWWIGSLVGSAIGGTAGNLAPTHGYSSRTYSSRHHYGSRYYGSRYATYSPRVYRSRACYTPTVYRTRPIVREVVVEKPVVVERQPVVEAAPYGFLEGGDIKSPWSDFKMSVGGLSPGDTVYDGYTGQAFRVP